ncbi:hypothetical protein DV738_g3463, partial [Chaetothyriales sp. CBS 135597]
MHIALGFTIAWGVAAALAVAFMCGIPVPWAAAAAVKCPSSLATWTAIEALGILLEISFQGLMIFLVASLQMSIKRKIAVETRASSLNGVIVVVVTQVTLHYSLWSATLPCMGAFLRAFDTGLGATTNVATYATSSGQSERKHSAFAMKYLSGRSRGSVVTQPMESNGSNPQNSTSLTSSQSTTHVADDHQTPPSWKKSNETSRSASSSKQPIIRKTTEWQVEYDESQT